MVREGGSARGRASVRTRASRLSCACVRDSVARRRCSSSCTKMTLTGREGQRAEVADQSGRGAAAADEVQEERAIEGGSHLRYCAFAFFAVGSWEACTMVQWERHLASETWARGCHMHRRR